MRGRKPKPTAQKQRQGNPGKRPLNKREPKPKTTEAKPKVPHAKKATLDGVMVEKLCESFAAQYLPELRTTGIYTDADKAAFELMAMHYALSWTAAEIIQREGLVVFGVKGEKKHPLLQVVRENSTAFKAYAAEFGMTPSARSRIMLPDPGDKDHQLEMELFGPTAQVSK